MQFTTDLKKSVSESDVVFICVGTPTKKNGSAADLSQVYNVAKEIRKSISKFKIIITKSTVPVTTGDEIHKIILKLSVASVCWTCLNDPSMLIPSVKFCDVTDYRKLNYVFNNMQDFGIENYKTHNYFKII